jgi:type I restriction enzyme S subunit
MTGLPTGWSAQTVKDLLSIRYGKSLAANLRVADGKYPVVGSAGEMARTDESLINGPTIVVGRKGNVGAVQLLTEGGWPIDTTYLSQVSDDLDPRFVAHQLTSLRLVRLDSSTATPSLRRQDYEVQELVVPPLDEQRRIVDILEDHLSRLDAATALLVSADRRASAWSRSVVDVTLWDHKCPRTQVADLLAEQMRNGHSARAVRDGLAGIRTLTLTAVTRNEFTDVFTKVTSADPDRVKGLWLRSQGPMALI